jgi:transglutaminase-like putative cysteine protease
LDSPSLYESARRQPNPDALGYRWRRRIVRTTLIAALFAAATLACAQNINDAIRQAEQRGEWSRVAELQLSIIRKDGFHFASARGYLSAMKRAGRAAEALKVAQAWQAPRNEPGCWASLADAHIGAGDYAGARTQLKKFAGRAIENRDAAAYLEGLIDAVATRRYELTWSLKPDETRKMKPEWFAPPQAGANQRLVDLKIVGGTLGKERRDRHENRLLEIHPHPGQTLTIVATVDLWPHDVSAELGKVTGTVPSELAGYLGASAGIDASNRTAQAFVETVRGQTLTERARSVMLHVNRTLKYGVAGSPPGMDSGADCIARGGGHCESLSMAVCVYLRAAGIPARMIRGQSAIVGVEGVMKQHTVPEYYLPGIGWRDWDHNRAPFESRANFVRLGSYGGARWTSEDVAPMFFFQGREFSAPEVFRNGPYRYKLLAKTLD